MPDKPIDFHLVERIEANALGQPGQRTFRLLIYARGQLAVLWLEKEQLAMLGEALEQVLAQVGLRDVQPVELPDLPGPPADADIEFRMGQLQLGFDHDRGRFVILVHAQYADTDEPPDFQCQITASQARRLSEQITEVVNAGRPRCRLCGQPINPDGHVCPKANGHLPITLEE
jgi:uncharacterized repeat protein (TIGR03847 family)